MLYNCVAHSLFLSPRRTQLFGDVCYHCNRVIEGDGERTCLDCKYIMVHGWSGHMSLTVQPCQQQCSLEHFLPLLYDIDCILSFEFQTKPNPFNFSQMRAIQDSVSCDSFFSLIFQWCLPSTRHGVSTALPALPATPSSPSSK